MTDIYVVKRNEMAKERLDINKIHDMMQHACEHLYVSSSESQMTSDLQFYNNMSTDDIQQILIRSTIRSNQFRNHQTINTLYPDFFYSV